MSISDANSTRTHGSAPLGNPATRNIGPIRARCGRGKAIMYVLGIVLVFALPFALPVAYSHAIKAADRFSTTVRREFSQSNSEDTLATQEQSPRSLTADERRGEEYHASSKISSREVPTASVTGPAPESISDTGETTTQEFIDNGVEPIVHQSEVHETKSTQSSQFTSASDNSHPSFDVHSQPVAISNGSDAGQAHSHPSYMATLEPASRDLVNPDGHEATTDPWIPHVEVVNGNLLLARTFERRLNAELAPQLAQIGDGLWGRTTVACNRATVTFSTNQSPRLEAELHIATQCGGGKSCILKPQLKDFRTTTVSLGDDADPVHYVQTKTQDNLQVHKWGPLRGALKVILLDSTILFMQRYCEDPAASSSRLISVQDLREVLQHQQEARTQLGGSSEVKALVENALSYHAQPHHHINAGDGSLSRKLHSP